MKKTVLVMMVVLAGFCGSVRGEIIEITWDEGHHIFNEVGHYFVYMYNDASADIIGGTIDEFYMYNETTVDVTGGSISAMLVEDTSSVDVFAGSDIDTLRPNDSGTANIYGGTISDTLFTIGSSKTNIYGGWVNSISTGGLSEINLYTENYELVSDDFWNGGRINGTWLESEEYFSIGLGSEYTINRINFVPEPGTVCLFTLAGLIVSRVNKRNNKQHKNFD